MLKGLKTMTSTKKTALVLSVLTVLLAVSRCEDSGISKTKPALDSDNWETLCIDRVEYVFFWHRDKAAMSVKLDTNSKVVTCGR